MCGRYTLHTEKEILARRFRIDPTELEGLAPHYNVAPSQPVFTVRRRGDARAAERMRWGLVPHWAERPGERPGMINARVETLPTRPAYRDSFRHRRCLVLADGFYEWKPAALPRRPKTPYWIRRRDGEPFAMAGLWASWRDPAAGDSASLHSCTIVTAPANAAIAPLHDRMPIILRPDAEDPWLDPALDRNPQALLELLTPIPPDLLHSHPVSLAVNSPQNDTPDLIAPFDPTQPTTGSLL